MTAKIDTWMPLYVGDYLADTQHLSTLEHGAYLLLLMTYWRIKGPLPDDDMKLSRMCRLSLKQWKAIRPTIIEFFLLGDGQLVSTRSETEIHNSKMKSEKARANALERYKTADADAAYPLCETPAERLLAGGRAPVPPSPSPNPTDYKSTGANKLDAGEFLEFWKAYPEKAAKPTAMKAFDKARKKAALAEIMAGLARYIAAKPIDRSWAHPATWLNQERWTDGESSAPSLLNLPPRKEPPEVVRWRGRLAACLTLDYWDFSVWGDPWNDHNHQIPPALLDEFPALRQKYTKLRVVK